VPDTPILFENVEMLATSRLGHVLRINGRVVFVGYAVPFSGTTVAAVGQVGRLVLPRWFVQQENIDGGTVLR
jgi:hypothetical protein